MAAAVELLVADQGKVGFMDQRGGVEGVAGPLLRQSGGGEPSQLVVDEREQVGGSFDQSGDVRHGPQYIRCGRPQCG
jgi:hypothetical protein